MAAHSGLHKITQTELKKMTQIHVVYKKYL